MAEEQKIGVVEKYFSKIGVAAIRVTDGALRVGDRIRIRGHTTDLEATIDSMQMEHVSVEKADPGASIGVKVPGRVREHDVVYKIVP